MAFHFHIENPQNFQFGEWGWKTIKVQGSCIIGRNSPELQIGITEISRAHIEITETEGKLKIANKSTKQGTYVWAQNVWGQNKGDFIPIASGNTYSVNDGLWIQLSGNPIKSSGWRMEHSVRLVVCESPKPDEKCWEKLVPPCAIGQTFEDKENSINEYCDKLLRSLSPSTLHGSELPSTDPPEAAGINEFRKYAIKKTKYVGIRKPATFVLHINSWNSILKSVYNTTSSLSAGIINQLNEKIALDFELTIPQVISLLSFIYSAYIKPSVPIPSVDETISSFKNYIEFFPTRITKNSAPYRPRRSVENKIVQAAAASSIILGRNKRHAGKLLEVSETTLRKWIKKFNLREKYLRKSLYKNQIELWQNFLSK